MVMQLLCKCALLFLKIKMGWKSHASDFISDVMCKHINGKQIKFAIKLSQKELSILFTEQATREESLINDRFLYFYE